MARCPKDCKKNTGAKFKENRTPNVVLRAWDQKDPRKPTFLLNSVGHGFLDPSRPYHRRIRVGIIRHGHWNRAQRQGHLRLRAKSPQPLPVSLRPSDPAAQPPLPPDPAPRPPRPEQASWARNLSRFPLLGMATVSGWGRLNWPGPRAISRPQEPAPGATEHFHPAPRPSRTEVAAIAMISEGSGPGWLPTPISGSQSPPGPNTSSAGALSYSWGWFPKGGGQLNWVCSSKSFLGRLVC